MCRTVGSISAFVFDSDSDMGHVRQHGPTRKTAVQQSCCRKYYIISRKLCGSPDSLDGLLRLDFVLAA